MIKKDYFQKMLIIADLVTLIVILKFSNYSSHTAYPCSLIRVFDGRSLVAKGPSFIHSEN